MNDPVTIAATVAEEVLFPNALATDQADLVSRANLDALAQAGLYGMFGPAEFGGHSADLATASEIAEHLAGGCLTTALVWLQHHGLVGKLLLGADDLRARMLGDLCSGATRAGIVFAGLLPGPSPLHATRCDGSWILDGHAPWVSGWGRIDVLQVAARGPDDTVVTLLLDNLDRPELTANRHRLAALNASGTVKLSFAELQVGDDHVVSIEPHAPADAGGQRLRLNGSLALGVARRCCALLGPGPHDEELRHVRDALDHGNDATMADARAAAAAFAQRVATKLVVTTGSRALEADNHAQRLAREAMFLLVFASRPSIKAGILERL